MEKIFRSIRQLIAENKSEALEALTTNQPEYFNWVKEIFEGIHVKDTPEAIALLWTEGNKTTPYSFSKMSQLSNQLINFLRKKGIEQENVILTQLAL